MRWWERQIGGKTRGRIIALLRRSPRTVDEIAVDLGVTNNGARAQLQVLAREGLVREAGTRGHTGAGKPASLFAMAPEAESALSSAYAPLLAALLESMKTRLSRKQMSELLRDAGARLAPESSSTATFEGRVRAAAVLLRNLGAELDVEKTKDGFLLRGYACPLASAVRAEPMSCAAVEQLLSQAIGAPVRECCERTDGVRCRFTVAG